MRFHRLLLNRHMIVQSRSVSTSLRDGSVKCAQCGCTVWNPGRWRHRPVGCGSGSEMRSSLLMGCVADSRLVGGGMLAGSAADHCPLVWCRNVGVQRSYSLLDRHQQSYSFWLSQTNCSLWYRSWLSVVDLAGLTGPSWCTELPSPSWCCSWLALLDAGAD